MRDWGSFVNCLCMKHSPMLANQSIKRHILRQVRDEIKRRLDTEERLKIVLDMQDVVLLSSEAIGMIVVLSNVLRPRGGQLHLANVSDETYTVFEIMKLHEIVKVFDTIPGAISAFAA